jgi:hypothetical protein
MLNIPKDLVGGHELLELIPQQLLILGILYSTIEITKEMSENIEKKFEKCEGMNEPIGRGHINKSQVGNKM